MIKKINFREKLIHSTKNRREYLVFLKDKINQRVKHQHISITNTELMYWSEKETWLKDYINNSALSLCDGVGIKIAGIFNKKPIIRYHGPDFFLDVVKYGVKFGWTHYLYGGKPGVAIQLQTFLEGKFAGCKIIGLHCPPFEKNPKIGKSVLDEINLLKPNFLWVGIGNPKQELFINNYKNKINTNFLSGIGATFDFYTGNVVRAPKFFQKIGMEWFYRTLFEKRLIIRQIRGFIFMFKAIFKIR